MMMVNAAQQKFNLHDSWSKWQKDLILESFVNVQ